MTERTDKTSSSTLWQRARALLAGPLLAGGTIASIELADSVGVHVPNPPSLLVMIVVFSAFSGGLRSGLITHAIACTYFALYYSVPGKPFHYIEDNLLRVIGYAVTTPVMILMASMAKRRADRLAEQSLQNEREHSASLMALLEERRKTEDKLHLAMEAAEAASRAKTEFLANVSHEVRTPMNGIIGLTLLTLETDLTREQRENLEMVRASADSLLMVINDILDFSKVEAGRLELDKVEIDVGDVVAEATKALALRAHEKGLELGYRIGPGIPPGLLGDPLRLRQVLINLVGNAIKFTDRGEVFVFVEGREVPGAGGAAEVELHFKVRDTGMGIPKNKQRMIFEAFAQADGSMKRKYEGTGLGLTISSRLVELMNGRLSVESEEGQGSTFHFTARLPIGPSETVAPPLPVAARAARVLIVDDNRTSAGILAELCAGWGLAPTVVEAGPAALEAAAAADAAETSFDLFLVDAGMPGMDGFAFAHALHERGSTAPVVMMLTTAGRRGARSNDRGLQIAAYVTKPIKTGDLLGAILRSLGAAWAGEGANRLPDREAPAPRRRAGLHLLLAEDNLVNQRLMVRLLEKAGHAVTIARTGREALEALAKAPFDMVLMDVQMPEMDGFETTAAIRAGERLSGKHLPLLALTAHAMRGDRERCLEAGFDGYVSKPIRFQDLFDAIDELAPPATEAPVAVEPAPAARPASVTRAPTNGAAHGAPPSPAAAVPVPAPRPASDSGSGERLAAFAEEAALESTGGDRDLLQELIGIFLTEAPGWMRDLEGALSRGDAAEVHRLAHTIKGAVDSCGAARAYDAAMLLERMGRGGELDGATAAYATLDRELTELRPELTAYAARSREA
jgi:signal transduction histidine kinase/DNA-binding response OmpR family regulator/HPt (histidine-containing phosphotransfer) domain-containing protein